MVCCFELCCSLPLLAYIVGSHPVEALTHLVCDAEGSVGAGGEEDDPFPMASMRAFAKASISSEGGLPSFFCSFWS